MRSNTYTPGDPLEPALHAVGRSVTLFVAETLKAGTVVRVLLAIDGTLLYDIKAVDGGTFRDIKLGTLMNPQPNTFVFAP